MALLPFPQRLQQGVRHAESMELVALRSRFSISKLKVVVLNSIAAKEVVTYWGTLMISAEMSLTIVAR